MWWLAIVMEETSDDELLRRYQRGDTRALGTLYDRHAPRVRAFVCRMGPERADDLVQDVFLRVVRGAGEFHGQSKFSTWLFAIARNVCLDTARRDKFRKMPSLDAPLGSDPDDRTMGETIRDESPSSDALRQSSDIEFRKAFDRAIATLPSEQREVFLMREFGDLQFAEIATMTGANENTVKSRMRYALDGLRRALKGFAD
jgi:RNA polymerase sigma-70 factor (ECF subfamily)